MSNDADPLIDSDMAAPRRSVLYDALYEEIG